MGLGKWFGSIANAIHPIVGSIVKVGMELLQPEPSVTETQKDNTSLVIAHQENGTIPLRILLSPPELDYDRFSESHQVFCIKGHLSEAFFNP